jgi:hypothetical protein
MAREAVVGERVAARDEVPAALVAADTVGLIFDVDDGLGYCEDVGMLWSAFADEVPSRSGCA